MKFAGYLLLGAAFVSTALAQRGERITANIRGGGGDGKCTFEVEVDGIAEVEIRGSQGFLRNISGTQAVWRRLDCNQPLPTNPYEFRFKGIDGRGRQSLVRDPGSNRGIAVIRVEDPKGGREGYTGDLLWKGGSSDSGSGGSGFGGGRGGWDNSGRGGSDNSGRGGGWDNSSRRGRGSARDAENNCRNEATRRFRVSSSDVQVDRAQDQGNGGYRVNIAVNRGGSTERGSCTVSTTGQVVQFSRDR